jgi:hypothetical protein
MTAEEIIELLLEKMADGESISVDELRDFVSSVSIKDTFARDNALTVLYSGENAT